MATRLTRLVVLVSMSTLVACSGVAQVADAGGGDGTGGGAGGSTGGGTGGAAAGGGPGGGTGGAPAVTACNDGLDNDGDGLIDWQRDLGCANAEDDDETAAPRAQEGGFTTYDLGSNSHVVYVSSSLGNDANTGATPSLAVKSLVRAAALVRDGQHDFLLLRRGDTWRGESLGRFKSGLDAAHPLVISAYGESTARPRVEVNTQFIDHDGQTRSFVAVHGLEVVSFPLIPGDPAWDGATTGGFRYVGGGQGLLIEDCHLLYADLVVQSYGGAVYDGVELRRNVIEQAYHVGTCNQNATFRPSGLYTDLVNHLTIEGNVFDHNGWSSAVSTACASMYNHNLYLDAKALVIKDNIIARASSMGIKLRSDTTGGVGDVTIENNLLVDGEIGIGIGGNTTAPGRFTNATIRNNVFTQIGQSNPTGRNFAWMLDVQDNVHTVIDGNYFLHQPWYTNAYGVEIAGGSESDVAVTGNLFYDLQGRSLKVQAAATGWSNVRVHGNTFVDPSHDTCLVDHSGGFAAVAYQDNAYASDAGTSWFCVDGQRRTFAQWQTASGESTATRWNGTFSAPERTVGSYAGTLQQPATLEGFLAAANRQSRLSWRTELTAGAVNDYVRAGFR